MTNKQKIWLGVFLAMLIIPEVIWGSMFGRFNLTDSIYTIENRSLYLSILFIQILGGILSLIYFVKYKSKKDLFHWLLLTILVLIIARAVFIFYVLFATKNMWG